MKKMYRAITKSTNFMGGQVDLALNTLAEQGFITIESVTHVGDGIVLIITSKIEYDSNETVQYTLTSNPSEDKGILPDMDDLLYGNTIEG